MEKTTITLAKDHTYIYRERDQNIKRLTSSGGREREIITGKESEVEVEARGIEGEIVGVTVG